MADDRSRAERFLDWADERSNGAAPRFQSFNDNGNEFPITSVWYPDCPERDWAMLRPHALYQLQNYASWFKAAGQPAFGDPPVDYADLERRGLYLCATPEQIVASIRSAYDAAPFDRHYFWAIWPGVDPAMATRSIELFARTVIPALRHLDEPGGSR